MNNVPSEYYVSIGDHPNGIRYSYYKASNESTRDWNINMGLTSNRKGYVNFSTSNQSNYQLTIIKIDNGHS